MLDDAASERRVGEIMSAKYGLEYKAMMGIEKVASSGPRDRVMLRITVDA